MIAATPTHPVLPLKPPSPWPLRLALAALTFLTLLLQGYHPFAEDGGLYVAGIEYTLDPTLFPHYTVFVTEHLRFSLFAPIVAGIVHHTHLPLPWVLLLTDILSIWSHLLRRPQTPPALHLQPARAARWPLPPERPSGFSPSPAPPSC